MSRTTQNQGDEVPPCMPVAAWRIVSASPFSTSKFDVGQINTLRPATFEVVPVDSGRPVNIGAIVPQRVVGTFWISGAVLLPPRCPFRTAAGITSGRSFPCKNQDHSARVSPKYTAASQRMLLSPFVRSFIRSFTRGHTSLHDLESITRTLSFLQILAKNKINRIQTNINNQRSL